MSCGFLKTNFIYEIKINQLEFSVKPFFQSIATMQGNVLSMTTRTSKGLVKSSMIFNQTFVVAVSYFIINESQKNREQFWSQSNHRNLDLKSLDWS